MLFLSQKFDLLSLARLLCKRQRETQKQTDLIIAIFDEDGTRDAAVTKLDLPRPTFHTRDLHNKPS